GSTRPEQPVQAEGPRRSANPNDICHIVEGYGDVRQDDVERWRELAAVLRWDFQDLPGGKCYEDDEEAMEDWKEFREILTSRESSASAPTSASTSTVALTSPASAAHAGGWTLEGVPGVGDHLHEPVRSDEGLLDGVDSSSSPSPSSLPLPIRWTEKEMRRGTTP
ncbi:unnamed protein product, partial [Sphacelaria rigidula]